MHLFLQLFFALMVRGLERLTKRSKGHSPIFHALSFILPQLYKHFLEAISRYYLPFTLAVFLSESVSSEASPSRAGCSRLWRSPDLLCYVANALRAFAT